MKYFNVKFKDEPRPRIIDEYELERLGGFPEYVEEIKTEKAKPVKNQDNDQSLFEG